MSSKNFFLLIATLLLISCNSENASTDGRAKAIEEINKAEKDFESMLASKGAAEAFSYYADSAGVIKRENDTIIRGKEAIRNYYSQPWYLTAKVNWTPDFTDASVNGDMGYTYGKYTWRNTDSTGKLMEFKGVFHTVWKKQSDGSWKYVWD